MSVTFSAHVLATTDRELFVPCQDGTRIARWSPIELEVNMSNSNAFRVCQALGIDLEAEGWCGSLPAEDFLGRVLMALAIEPVDAGVPAHEVPGPGARMIECGRREGYTQERLGQLRQLADWAVANNAEIGFS